MFYPTRPDEKAQTERPKKATRRPMQLLMQLPMGLLALALALHTLGCSYFGWKTVKVGHFTSLTGSESAYGISVNRGVKMAYGESVDAFKKNKIYLEIVTQDTESDRSRTIQIVEAFVGDRSIKALMGEIASDRSMAAAPIAEAHRIPMITPLSTNPAVTDVGRYIFRGCYIDPFQGSAMAKYVRHDLKIESVGLLINEKSNYSLGLAEYFRDTFTQLGGKVVAEGVYGADRNGQKDLIKRIRKKAPTALFIPDYFDEVQSVAQHLKRLGWSPTLLGGDGWESRRLYSEKPNLLKGAYYTSHFNVQDKRPVVKSFVNRFRALYGIDPDGVAAVAYDTASVLFNAILKSDRTTPDSIREHLSQTKNFEGVTGNYTFDSSRNPRKSLVILRVGDRGPEFKTREDP
jgi:branched-chain amino acid transport system substrate-binding protein